ncbi:MAG: flagellar hook-basal body protein FliE [Cereibacter sphaeroides]|uniref:Flagellar hook-basal body protein FliE n=1 Tax=Cereibacter sphaeroides TaxID=1063 RepID=A0A2W5SE78_CERSP|nr:MAG: flagellar hook-basal body protein FliE [Cereibacter sphaeroides]
MDVRSALAAQNYAQARPATLPAPQDGESNFIGAVSDFAQNLAKADQTAQAAMTGTADPYALVQALGASSMAVETVVTVRDKVVEAYQEILRMPV